MLINFIKSDLSPVTSSFTVKPLDYPKVLNNSLIVGEVLTGSSNITVADGRYDFQINTDNSNNNFYVNVSGSSYTVFSGSTSNNTASVLFNLIDFELHQYAAKSIVITPVTKNVQHNSKLVVNDPITWTTNATGSASGSLVQGIYNVLIKGDKRNTAFTIRASGSANAKDIMVQSSLVATTITPNNSASYSYTAQASDARYLLSGSIGNSQSASYSVSSSHANISDNATSSSFATTASYVKNATSASFSTFSVSASIALNALTASYSLKSISSSYAPQPDISGLATTGSNTFNDNQIISGSLSADTGSFKLVKTVKIEPEIFETVTVPDVTSSTFGLSFNYGAGGAWSAQGYYWEISVLAYKNATINGNPEKVYSTNPFSLSANDNGSNQNYNVNFSFDYVTGVDGYLVTINSNPDGYSGDISWNTIYSSIHIGVPSNDPYYDVVSETQGSGIAIAYTSPYTNHSNLTINGGSYFFDDGNAQFTQPVTAVDMSVNNLTVNSTETVNGTLNTNGITNTGGVVLNNITGLGSNVFQLKMTGGNGTCDFQTTNGGSCQMQFTNNNTANSWTIGMNPAYYGDERFVFRQSQIGDVFIIGRDRKVGIQTSGLPAYELDVAGDINFTGALRKNGSTYVPTNATSASFTTTASFATTSSYVKNATSSSYSSGSLTATTLFQLPISASGKALTPVASTGSAYFQRNASSNLLFIYNGTSWVSASLV